MQKKTITTTTIKISKKREWKVRGTLFSVSVEESAGRNGGHFGGRGNVVLCLNLRLQRVQGRRAIARARAVRGSKINGGRRL